LLKLHYFPESGRTKWTNFKKLGKEPYNLYMSWALSLKKINHKQSKLEMEETWNQKARKNNKPTQIPQKNRRLGRG
jgi:hypothetical protein